MNDALASLAVLAVGGVATALVAAEIVFQIICVGDLSEAGRARGLSPALWTIIIVALPVLGGMLYLTAGRDK